MNVVIARALDSPRPTPKPKPREIPHPRAFLASLRTVVVVATLIGVGSMVVAEMLPVFSVSLVIAHCCAR